MGVAAEPERQHNDRRTDHHVQHDVLDHGDHGRSSEAAGPGVECEHKKGEGERPLAGETEGGQRHLDADELECDVGQQREHAGEGDGGGEGAAAVAALDEVGEGDVVVAVADAPQPRQHQHHVRVGDDAVRDGKEAEGAAAEERRGNGDHGIGGVEIAAHQEPGDEGAEGAAGQTPLLKAGETGRGSPPARCPEARGRNQQEEEAEDDERDSV